MRHTPISAIILTKNEEQMIRRCIQSVGWADEIIVFDSESDDATREVAAEAGATVHSQPFLGWAKQRNAAMAVASSDWVLFVDCDEIVTGDLARAILRVTNGDMDAEVAYSVERKGDFLGLLLEQNRRENFIRLFNRHTCHYDPRDLVHEEVVVPGRVVELSGVLLHWRGYMMDQYVTVFNRYATIEAEQLSRSEARSSPSNLLFRPAARFLWLYLVKRGYRLGMRGVIHALLKSTADFIRYAKLWEIQNLPGPVLDPPERLLADFGGIVQERELALKDP